MTKVVKMDILGVAQAYEASLGLAERIVSARAMCADSGRGLTKFAATLTCLLDVTAQREELNEALRHSDGVVKQAMQFAHSSLVEQQLRTIEMLEDLSSHGGSILKDPDTRGSEANSLSMRKMSVPLGLSPPPGLAAPLGLSSPMASVGESVPSLSIERLLSMRPRVPMTQPKDRLKTMPAESLAQQCRESTMRPDAQEFAPAVKDGSSISLSVTAEEFVPSLIASGATLSPAAEEFLPVSQKKLPSQPLVNAAFFDDLDESDFEDVNSTCSASSACTSEDWNSE